MAPCEHFCHGEQMNDAPTRWKKEETGQKSSAGRNVAIDACRLLAFCGVVFIHNIQDSATLAVAEVGRFAVPFFFLVSGYFLPADYAASPGRTIWRITRRVGPVLVFWLGLYALVAPWLHPWRPRAPLLIDLLFYGGPGPHLWFLSSLLFCVASLTVSRRFMNWPAVLVLAAGLYLFDLAMGPYRPFVATLLPAGDWPGMAWNPRAGPFFGFLFVATGRFVAERRITASPWLTGSCALIFLFLNAAERLLIENIIGYRSIFGMADVRLMTIPYGVSVFLLILSVRSGWGEPRFRALPLLLARLGRMTLGMYGVHLAVLWSLAAWGGKVASPLLLSLAAIIVSIACVALLSRTPMRRVLV